MPNRSRPPVLPRTRFRSSGRRPNAPAHVDSPLTHQVGLEPEAVCDEEDYDRIFGINTKSVFFTLKEAARRLNDGGRIIVTSTGGTRMFFPDQSLYLGSKGAVEQFVRALSWELGGRRITVNAISPGPTETDMMKDRYRDSAAAKSPFNRVGDPGDVAAVAVFLATDAARWVTGQNIGAGGGVF